MKHMNDENDQDWAPFGIVVKMLNFHVGEQSSNPGRYIGAVTQIGFPRRGSNGSQPLP